MMSEVILTVGLPASGKSTWAREEVKRSKSEKMIVNRDDLRKMLFGLETLKKYRYSNEKEKIVTAVQHAIATMLLDRGKSVIVADTNLNSRAHADYAHLAGQFDAKITEKLFTEHPRVLIDRDSRRREQVGERVILDMYMKAVSTFRLPAFSSAVPDKLDEVYEPCKSFPNAIIVDVDGTVARHAFRGPYELDKVATDKLYEDVAELVTMYSTFRNAKIVFLSGRDGSCREETLKWLKRHFPFREFELLMRPADDMRADHVVKREIFFDDVASRYHVLCAFDDRDQVVSMWRQIGLRCYQVQHGCF
jgi:predicted kinase